MFLNSKPKESGQELYSKAIGKSKAQNVLNIHPLKSSGPKGYGIREMNKLISNEGDLHEANNVKETVEDITGALEAVEQLGNIYI